MGHFSGLLRPPLVVAAAWQLVSLARRLSGKMVRLDLPAETP